MSGGDGAPGWTFEEEIPVPKNLFSVFASVKTPLTNVFQAGQWTYSPSGVPVAILTGRLAAKQISMKL